MSSALHACAANQVISSPWGAPLPGYAKPVRCITLTHAKDAPRRIPSKFRTSPERRTARSGKDSTDHAPRAHDDIANAVASALVRGGFETRSPQLVSPLYQ